MHPSSSRYPTTPPAQGRQEAAPRATPRRRAPLFAGLLAACLAAFPAAAQTQPSQAALDAMKALYQRPTAIPYPQSNPYTPAKAALGRQLFFDTRLSGSQTASCASCHRPGQAWGDGLPTAVGYGGKDLDRRTPTVLNLAWGEVFFWDGRADTLEEQAVGPIQNPNEMNMPMPRLVALLNDIPGYRAAFNAVFPGEPISAGTIGKAIATFERAIVSGQAPFDRWIAGQENAIDESAKRGFVLFNTTGNCTACHAGWRFTDDSFHDIGLHDNDLGRGKLVEGVALLSHAFKTPSLRNVTERGPYMHNGALRTLSDVISHYNNGFAYRPSKSVEIRRLNLSNQEMQDVVSFLQTLTSTDPVITAPDLPSKETN